ncbi:3 beta-hydroxysteroid dehydrogenase type 4 [Hondaea fermentalgiana]|uniref:3 beta-hydroxysteroid dehydrogenase type 4 n=1 Tax=Hondaea fermentalgiana TaxID=2315210 RepID=A0A2R5GD52_9STRA|nr:3 beta-hydroxysteroid dehydrogenase type 4 [Hondaea fermentalgiana]|eukprot:GBG26543.1 3 beta-hydroxysteroid dehydrogenase type 4 [Hondaea fermentalgiana]
MRLATTLALLVALPLTSTVAVKPEDGCVLVSGATGFVAGHTIEVLLSKGFTVHGTVRSLEDEHKYSFLREIEDEMPGSLELFEADILEPKSFDQAAKGCSSMLHIASAVVTAGLNPQTVVDTAVAGTRAALDTAKKHQFKALVVTSSVATIFPDKDRLEKLGKDYPPATEADWNTFAQPDFGTYAYSKVMAEKSTLQWLDENEHDFRYASVHFPFAIGPQQAMRVTSSNLLVKVALSGELPLALPLRSSIVDVRDVARAHVHLLEQEAAKGRYIVALDPDGGSSTNPRDCMNILKRGFPDSPIPIFQYELPTWAAKILSKIDSRVDVAQISMSDYFDKHPGYIGTRIVDELGFEYKYTNTSETILDAGQSMVDLGIVDFDNQTVNPVIVAFMASPLLGLIVLGILYTVCCSTGVRLKEKKN